MFARYDSMMCRWFYCGYGFIVGSFVLLAIGKDNNRWVI